MRRQKHRPPAAPSAPTAPEDPATAPDAATASVPRTESPGHQGAWLAIAAVSVTLVMVAASRARLGFGRVGDVLIGLAALGVLAGIYALSARLAVAQAPRIVAGGGARTLGVLLAASVVLSALIGVGVAKSVALLTLVFVGIVGAAVAEAVAVVRGVGRWRRAASLTAAAAFVPLVSAMLMAQINRAARPAPASASAGASSRTGALAMSSTARGPLRVSTLRYGSGSDERRPAYRDSVTLRSAPVDLLPLLPARAGWRVGIHRNYWGFGLDQAPLNAIAWLPATDTPVPLALIVHGVSTDEQSEEGFAYLGELLASRGIAAVSVDANFLSGPWMAVSDAGMAARSWLLLRHLRQLAAWNEGAGTPFSGRLDLSSVALVGHSRGGEAAAVAAMLSTLRRHPDAAALPPEAALRVRAVVALSPTDGLYRPGGEDVTLDGINYLLVRGTHDADVPSEAGSGQYDRSAFAADRSALKMALRLQGANHSQFNARWGPTDHAPPLSWLLRRDGVMPAAMQRDVAAGTVVAFLEATIGDSTQARHKLLDPQGSIAGLLAVGHSVRVLGGETLVLAAFDEDVDPATATLPGSTLEAHGLTRWSEERPLRRPSAVARLAWQRRAADTAAPSFEVRLASLPTGVTPSLECALTFALASVGGETDFTIELEDARGQVMRTTLAEHGGRGDAESVALWNSVLLEASRPLPARIPLRTFQIPFSAFAAPSSSFDPRTLRVVRFVFDRANAGSVVLDDIGIEPARP